jgi:hypothetical protein
MIITATLNLTDLGITLDEWNKFTKFTPYKIESFSEHIRDMSIGWRRIANIADLRAMGNTEKFRLLLNEPGVYAVCWDPGLTIVNPVINEKHLAIKFGESVRECHHRIVSHVQALYHAKSNTYANWLEMRDKIITEIGVDVFDTAQHQHIWIWVRPHAVTDPLPHGSTKHPEKFSQLMERHAHAFYAAHSGRMAPANNRELPTPIQISTAAHITGVRAELTDNPNDVIIYTPVYQSYNGGIRGF